MVLSEEFVVAQTLAKQSLDASQEGELELPWRKRLWAALGPRLVQGQRAVIGTGLRRRVHLAKLSVSHVIDLWDALWPQDSGPEKMMVVAEQFLAGSISFEVAWREKNAFWGHVESMLAKMGQSSQSYVGFAAANVVTVALNDELFDVETIGSDGHKDEDLDPYEWDASYYASGAYAYGLPGEDGASQLRRREFWDWWIRDAAESAWNV